MYPLHLLLYLSVDGAIRRQGLGLRAVGAPVPQRKGEAPDLVCTRLGSGLRVVQQHRLPAVGKIDTQGPVG